MIALDLKLTIFIILLLILVLVTARWWLATLTRPPRPTRLGWQVFETLPFGIAVVQPDGQPAFMNQTAQTLMEQLEPGSVSSRWEKFLQRFNYSAEAEALQRSGMIHQPLFLRWWCYPLEDDFSLLVLAEGSDQQRFVRQQAFVGQLVHELRTPLTALVAHAEIAQSKQTGETTRAASMETIQSMAQRMGRLVRDMLELHRLETTGSLPLQPTNLVLVAEDAIAQLILRAEDCGVNLNFESDIPLPLALAHPDRLKQVFLNLIDNAIKYCRAGDEVRVILKAETEGVLCRVQDQGPGISVQDLPHVTECFYRGRTDVDGNGIGLALVSEILRHHNSSLQIESKTGEGVSGTKCSWLLSYVP
jgi:two-component system phosphate regulon sensor histidine kinase PhoR